MKQALTTSILTAAFSIPATAADIYVYGDTEQNARSLFNTVSTEPLAQCGTILRGYVCSSVARPAPPVAASPAPSAPDGSVTVAAPSLMEARERFERTTDLERADCDRYARGWLCSSKPDPTLADVAAPVTSPAAPTPPAPPPAEPPVTGSPAAPPAAPSARLARIDICDTAAYDVTENGARPDDGRTDHGAINDTIERAHDKANSIAGTCSVQVDFPSGTYDTTQALLVPGRVVLNGSGVGDTRIHYRGDFHATQIRNPDTDSRDAVANVGYRNLEITMNGGDGASGNGHCISSVRGITDSLFQDLHLNGCDGYGIGWQQSRKESFEAPYERLTVRRVKINKTGSDGVDIKSTLRPNDDLVFQDVCITDIAYSDDGRWASALDLAGNDILVDGFTFINPRPVVNGTNVSAIDVNDGQRTVTNSTFRNFYVDTAVYGVIFHPDGRSRNITLGDGVVKGTLNGIALGGSGHSGDGRLFMEGGRNFSNNGNDVQLSDSRPDGDFFRNGGCASF